MSVYPITSYDNQSFDIKFVDGVAELPGVLIHGGLHGVSTTKKLVNMIIELLHRYARNDKEHTFRLVTFKYWPYMFKYDLVTDEELQHNIDGRGHIDGQYLLIACIDFVVNCSVRSKNGRSMGTRSYHIRLNSSNTKSFRLNKRRLYRDPDDKVIWYNIDEYLPLNFKNYVGTGTYKPYQISDLQIALVYRALLTRVPKDLAYIVTTRYLLNPQQFVEQFDKLPYNLNVDDVVHMALLLEKEAININHIRRSLNFDLRTALQ